MKTRRLKALAEINPPCSHFERLPEDADVAFVPMEGVGFNTLELELRSKSDVLTGFSRFEEGDVLLPKISPTFAHGRVVVAENLPAGVGTGTTELHVLRPRPGVDSHWLRYVTLSEPFMQQGFASYYGVAGQKRISLDWLVNYRVPIVDTAEQQRIARHLDDRCARIEALIGEVQRQLALVSEHKQSVVDTTITRGVTSSPVRPVATLWNIEVPTGWDVLPLRYAVDDMKVGIVVTPSRYYEDEGVPVLRGLNVRPGRVEHEDLVFMSDHSNMLHSKSILHRNDVVIVRTGNAGSAALVPDWAVGGNAVDLLIVRPGPNFVPEFLELMLNSDLMKQQVAWGSVGALQEHFNVGALAASKVVLPSLDEQSRIVSAIQAAHQALNELGTVLEGQLRLLAEHRRALITAVVTGRPDIESAA